MDEHDKIIKPDEKVIIEKATQVAFLSLRGLSCKPVVGEDGRVRFEFAGPVLETLAELQQNPKVNILDFINRLDAVRSVIFTLKDKH